MLKGLRQKALLLSLSSTSLVQSTSSNNTNSEANYEKIISQVHDFEIALKAMDYLLDDHSQEGIVLLKKESTKIGNDPQQPHAIFPLALGVMEFIEATLGFEPEVMAKAHKTLSEAETVSLNNSKYNVKHQLATSKIYPPGTEFQVTYAESTLLNALLMLLTENNGMVESAKALFKLRKAYQTLDSIHKRITDLEKVFNKNIQKLRKEAQAVANGSKPYGDGIISLGNHSVSTVDLPGFVNNGSSQNSSSSSLAADLKLIKDLEKIYMMRKSRIEGTSLGNNINPDKVDLFHVLDTSLLKNGDDINVGTASTASSKEGQEENEESDDDDDEFSDALDSIEPSIPIDTTRDILASSATSLVSSIDTTPSLLSSNQVRQLQDDHLHVSTIDEFIHSGVQLCFGILQVVLSLIPPAIGKVLSIVGFKGDRVTGLKLLWRTAITSRNIHGELALIFLLVFYDGPVQFVDVGFKLPEQENSNARSVIQLDGKASVSEAELDVILESPSLHTNQLLRKVRKYFPHNALWILQEGRMLAAQGELHKASELMQSFTDDPNNRIQMQQVEALLIFDRAMVYMFQHEYDRAAKDLIYLIEINSWSKAVYLFMAASCYLEKYRSIKMGISKVDDKQSELAKYSKLFEKYMNLALSYVPGHGANASKKGGIGGSGKQMPFDKFLLRKYGHLEQRKKQYPNLPLVDLVGSSLLHELIYFWNGYNRMTKVELADSLKLLGYSGSADSLYSANTGSDSFALINETEDEAMIRYFLQSVCLRLLDKVKEGLSVLETNVISKYVTSDTPQFKFTKMTYSPYIYPTALYEKTMFVWVLRTQTGGKIDVKHAVEESKSWLKKAETVGEGDYELSNRTGMRIKAAGDRLEQLGRL